MKVTDFEGEIEKCEREILARRDVLGEAEKVIRKTVDMIIEAL